MSGKAQLRGAADVAYGHSRRFWHVRDMSASLIGPSGSSTFRLSIHAVSMSLAGSCFSSESAPGPSIMGSEDEAARSFGRPCRQCGGGSKRTYELTLSIVPRGTSFHCWVDFDFLLSRLIL